MYVQFSLFPSQGSAAVSIERVTAPWIHQDLFLAPVDDVTMVICPGIANHSEKQYIRTFVDYAQKNGYRCAVLNHLGALPNIELTSPRMFTYGKPGAWPAEAPGSRSHCKFPFSPQAH